MPFRPEWDLPMATHNHKYRVPDHHHPFPALRAQYLPLGWSVWATSEEGGVRYVHAVLCSALPRRCAEELGMTEHVRATPDEFPAVMERRMVLLEGHARTCPACARTLDHARRLAALH